MNDLEIYIKNMVSSRCLASARQVLISAGYEVMEIEMGYAVIGHHRPPKRAEIHSVLEREGFSLIRTSEDLLIENVKHLVIELVQENGIEGQKIKTSHYLSEKLGKSYGRISKIFSKVTGTTVEKYTIQIKIERVKELLQQGDGSLSEIAKEMNYSSVQYLSQQFRKVTGMTISSYREGRMLGRQALDEV